MDRNTFHLSAEQQALLLSALKAHENTLERLRQWRISDQRGGIEAVRAVEREQALAKKTRKVLAEAESIVAQPANAPLTLGELREMDGQPVWNDTMKKWVLVDLAWEYGERTVDAGGKWRKLDDRYYRRRPEEERHA